jgi:heterodisulfide reductase subunit D
VEKPEITKELSRRRVERAADLEVDTLISACPWSERPLSAAGEEQGVAVMDLFELVAEAAGIEVGGRTGATALAQEAGR